MAYDWADIRPQALVVAICERRGREPRDGVKL